MAEVQYIEAPGGSRLAVLPEEEYDRLRAAEEDLMDSAAFERVVAQLERGETELIPFEMAERLLDGENPVRVWREYRGLQVKALAGKAGISAAYLSQIEGGKRDGALSTMAAIARALGVDLDDLVTPPAPPGATR